MQRFTNRKQTMRFCLLSLAALGWAAAVMPAAAETDANPWQAEYEHAQSLRDEARQLAGDGSDPAALRQAAAKLEAALAYLAEPEVSAKSTGNVYLYMRGYDVHRELARIDVQLGLKDKALDELEAMNRFVWIPDIGKILADDAAFAPLENEPRFQAVLAAAAMPLRLWNVPAIATPFKKTLSVEERVAGLSLFWAEARQNFAHFDHVPALEWDKVYLDYLGKVMAAKTTEDYYRVMMQLAPLLQDGHTNVMPPQELRDEFYAKPPITTALVEGKVLVLAVRSATLARRVKPGDEIVAIDGIEAHRYAEQKVAPFVSASTPQDRQERMFGYQLLNGAASRPLKLRLRAGSGTERMETVARSGYTDVTAPEPFAFRMLDKGVAYFSLDHFESNEGVQAFEKVLPKIMEAKALILDLRRNGGGSSNFGYAILGYLTEQPIPTEISFQRAEDVVMRAQGGPSVKWAPLPRNGQLLTMPKREQVFNGKVVVLTSADTYSAAEDFVVAYQSMKRGLTVGEPTGGSTGQPLLFALPGGGKARICVKRDLFPDGREFVGRGIAPDVVVGPTVEGIRSGHDTVLERAVEAARE